MASVGKFERFSSNERSILFGLVRTYANVIENKKTDYSNLTAKKDAWAQIECQFNSHPDVTKVRKYNYIVLRRIIGNINVNSALLVRRCVRENCHVLLP